MIVSHDSFDLTTKIEKIIKGNEQQQQIQLRPRTHLTPGMLQDYKRTYIKVKPESKDQLCQLVLKEGQKIIEVAKMLKIKYATAKTIIFHLRRERKQRKQNGTRQCGVSELKVNKIQKIRIISLTSDTIITVLEHQFPSSDTQTNTIKTVPSSASISMMVGSITQ